MDAEVAVGGFENALEVIEAEAGVGGECADDAEANALVNQTVEFGELKGARRDMLASRGCGLRSRSLTCGAGRVF